MPFPLISRQFLLRNRRRLWILPLALERSASITATSEAPSESSQQASSPERETSKSHHRFVPDFPPSHMPHVQPFTLPKPSIEQLGTWDRIPALANVSGLGYYSTKLDWPPSGLGKEAPASGAYLNIGRVLHTARLIINDQQTPPLDYFRSEVDISPYLKDGKKDIAIVTAMPMWKLP